MPDAFCTPEAVGKTIFYKSAHFNVLYNIRPVVPGHILFVSIRHLANITELNEEENKDLHKVINFVLPKILKQYSPEDNSYTLVVQSGPSSGGSIPTHFHVHIVPRRPNDRYRRSLIGLNVDTGQLTDNLDMEHVNKEVTRLRKEFDFKE